MGSENMISRMAKNEIILGYVDRVHANRRDFKKGNETVHVHDIYLVDSTGKRYRGEYIIPSDTQELFQVGSYVKVECVYTSNLGDEILPYQENTWHEITGFPEYRENTHNANNSNHNPVDIDHLLVDNGNLIDMHYLQSAATLASGYMFASGDTNKDNIIENTMYFYHALKQQNI